MDRLKANISDVPDLISRLQHENLFVNDERKTIRELNEKVLRLEVVCSFKIEVFFLCSAVWDEDEDNENVVDKRTGED